MLYAVADAFYLLWTGTSDRRLSEARTGGRLLDDSRGHPIRFQTREDAERALIEIKIQPTYDEFLIDRLQVVEESKVREMGLLP